MGHFEGSEIVERVEKMATVTKIVEEEIVPGGASIVWKIGPINSLPRPARLAAGAYVHAGTGVGATVIKAPPINPGDPVQNIQENRCHPATFLCNVKRGTFLLTADNRGWGPIQIDLPGNGVSAIGSFAVAQWKPILDQNGNVRMNPDGSAVGIAYTVSLYVKILQIGVVSDWQAASTEQGYTGDIFSAASPSQAPFVGCQVAPGGRIVAARFDMGHSQDGNFTPVGITDLYFIE